MMQVDHKTQRLLTEIAGKVDSLVSILASRPPAPFEDASENHGSSSNLQVLESVANISKVLEEDKLHSAIVAGAIKITGAARGFLMLMEDGVKLRFKAGKGITQKMLMTGALDSSRSMIKEVIKAGHPVRRNASSGASPGETALGIPIPIGQRIQRSTSSKKVAGIIYVDSHDPSKSLGDEEEDLLLIYARHVSIALENAWLFSEGRR